MSERQPSFMIPDAVPGDPKQIQAVQSIRNTRDSRNVDASPAGVEQQLVQQEDFWRDATTPERIMELKSEYDDRVRRSADESRFSFDKRAGVQHGDRERVKGDVIDRYLQSGADPKNPRKVPSGLRTNVSNLMNMSYDQLQELADKQSARRNANKPAIRTLPGAPVEPTAPKPADEPVADAYPELGLSDDERMRQRLADILKIKDPELREDALNHFRERVGDEQADAFGVPPRTVPPEPAHGGSGEPPEPPQPAQPGRQERVYEASAESRQALANLEEARDQLALLVGQRRARMFNFLRFRENRQIRELRRDYDHALSEYNRNFREELQKANVSAADVYAFSWQEVTNESYRLGMTLGAAEYAAQDSAREGANRGVLGRVRRGLRWVTGFGVRNEVDPEPIIERAQAFPDRYEANRRQNIVSLTTAEEEQTNNVVWANRWRAGGRALGAAALVGGVAAVGLVGEQQVAHHVASNVHHAQAVGNALQHAASGGSPDNLPAAAPTPPTPVLDIRPGDWQWNVAQRMVAPGVNPEAWLHNAFNTALANGHTGHIGHNPNGTEYFVVDGTDDVRRTMDVLVQYAS